MSERSYDPVSAFAGVRTTAGTGTGTGVRARQRQGLGIARVAARTGQLAALERLVESRFGIVLPEGPRRTDRHEVAAAGIGPQTWLMTCENAANAFAADLRLVCADHAAVVDLSDAYAMVRLTGAKLRQALAKLVPIDLHARSFAAGTVAQTVAEHMAVTLWRLEDSDAGEAVFELCAGRSVALGLYRAIRDSAAEFGFAFEFEPA